MRVQLLFQYAPVWIWNPADSMYGEVASPNKKDAARLVRERTVVPHGCGTRAYMDVFTACPGTDQTGGLTY